MDGDGLVPLQGLASAGGADVAFEHLRDCWQLFRVVRLKSLCAYSPQANQRKHQGL